MEMKDIAVKALKGACKVFLQDLSALPEAAFTHHFGGTSRTVADVVYEVNMVNDHIAMTIRGEEPFAWPDGWITAPDDFASKRDVVQAFQKSSTQCIELFESLTEADFEKTVQTEHGETNVFERCRFMSMHIWYHSGQINFIQTLLGDDKWHWQ